jgi:Mrp family chromosome partitioning ATPase
MADGGPIATPPLAMSICPHVAGTTVGNPSPRIVMVVQYVAPYGVATPSTRAAVTGPTSAPAPATVVVPGAGATTSTSVVVIGEGLGAGVSTTTVLLAGAEATAQVGEEPVAQQPTAWSAKLAQA